MSIPNSHKKFMRAALKEAKRARGRTGLNPLVGAVIVKGAKIIAKGFHKRFGACHAEIEALRKAGKKAYGATLYVTLEPCSHFGKTPPCTNAIISSGIKEVIAAMKDPNPVNRGRGFKILKNNGIKVISGVLNKEARKLNAPFIKRMKVNKLFIAIKMAQSLDGKIAANTGNSKWISSKASRRIVQKLRSNYDAIMVGINTVLKDDPRLSIRGQRTASEQSERSPERKRRKDRGQRTEGRGQIKIIVDTNLRTPADARIFKNGRVIIAAAKSAPREKERQLAKKGAEIIRLSSNSGRIDLKQLMRALTQRGITSALVEGGGELAASFLENKLADKIFFFVAPIIIGGRNAITSVEGKGIKRLGQAVKLINIKTKKTGRDFLIEADL